MLPGVKFSLAAFLLTLCMVRVELRVMLGVHQKTRHSHLYVPLVEAKSQRVVADPTTHSVTIVTHPGACSGYST